MTYDEAFALLRKYNSEPFHITHALTVSNVMRRMADELGYGDEADFEAAWQVINQAVEALVARFLREGASLTV